MTGETKIVRSQIPKFSLLVAVLAKSLWSILPGPLLLLSCTCRDQVALALKLHREPFAQFLPSPARSVAAIPEQELFSSRVAPAMAAGARATPCSADWGSLLCQAKMTAVSPAPCALLSWASQTCREPPSSPSLSALGGKPLSELAFTVVILPQP